MRGRPDFVDRVHVVLSAQGDSVFTRPDRVAVGTANIDYDLNPVTPRRDELSDGAMGIFETLRRRFESC